MDGVPVVTQSLTLDLLGPGGWVHPPSCLLQARPSSFSWHYPELSSPLLPSWEDCVWTLHRFSCTSPLSPSHSPELLTPSQTSVRKLTAGSLHCPFPAPPPFFHVPRLTGTPPEDLGSGALWALGSSVPALSTAPAALVYPTPIITLGFEPKTCLLTEIIPAQ